MSERQFAEVGGISLFLYTFTWPLGEGVYETLPDRQDLQGLPVGGATYRDRAHPGVVFRCMQEGANWARYRWGAFRFD